MVLASSIASPMLVPLLPAHAAEGLGDLPIVQTPLKTAIGDFAEHRHLVDANVGYRFIPKVDGFIVGLGSSCAPGERTVRLYRESDAAELAMAAVSTIQAGVWNYTEVSPVLVSSGTSYVVASRSTGDYCLTAVESWPIEGTAVRIEAGVGNGNLATDAMPQESTGWNVLGLPDVKFLPLGIFP